MKIIKIILSILFLLTVSVSSAQAVVCGSNYRGAGCVGSNGAVVKRHGYSRTPVVVPNNHYRYHRNPYHSHYRRYRYHCTWVHGRKICR